MGKNVFKSFTELDVAMHNARVAGRGDKPDVEGVEDESELHRQIIDYCKQRRWVVVHSRMDMATTVAVGTTDFVIAADNGKSFWIEAKAKGKKLTREQAGTLHWLQSLGHCAEAVYSFGQFLDTVTDKEGPVQPNQTQGEAK